MARNKRKNGCKVNMQRGLSKVSFPVIKIERPFLSWKDKGPKTVITWRETAEYLANVDSVYLILKIFFAFMDSGVCVDFDKETGAMSTKSGNETGRRGPTVKERFLVCFHCSLIDFRRYQGFATSTKLNLHLNSVHQFQPRLLWRCGQCLQIFKENADLKAHKDIMGGTCDKIHQDDCLCIPSTPISGVSDLMHKWEYESVPVSYPFEDEEEITISAPNPNVAQAMLWFEKCQAYMNKAASHKDSHMWGRRFWRSTMQKKSENRGGRVETTDDEANTRKPGSKKKKPEEPRRSLRKKLCLLNVKSPTITWDRTMDNKARTKGQPPSVTDTVLVPNGTNKAIGAHHKIKPQPTSATVTHEAPSDDGPQGEIAQLMLTVKNDPETSPNFNHSTGYLDYQTQGKGAHHQSVPQTLLDSTDSSEIAQKLLALLDCVGPMADSNSLVSEWLRDQEELSPIPIIETDY